MRRTFGFVFLNSFCKGDDDLNILNSYQSNRLIFFDSVCLIQEGPDNAFSINAMRLAEVWLDEFKEVFYRQAPTQIRKLDIGDIRDRRVCTDMLDTSRLSCLV